VDTDANANRTGQPFSRVVGRRKCTRRRRECDKERIALRVDLDAAVRLERLSQYAAMLGERLRIRLRAELVQQARRPLHIREEEGHGARRELAPHGRIMRLTAGAG
jgi:hypothetical protein